MRVSTLPVWPSGIYTIISDLAFHVPWGSGWIAVVVSSVERHYEHPGLHGSLTLNGKGF